MTRMMENPQTCRLLSNTVRVFREFAENLIMRLPSTLSLFECVCVNLHVYAISRKGISPEDTWPTDCAAGEKKTD